MEFGAEVKIIAGALLVCAIIFSYKWTYDAGASHQKQVDIVEQVAANKAAMKKYDEISVELQTTKEKTNVVYRTITKEVQKVVLNPVYGNVCIDDAGKLLINDAIKGTHSGEPSD